LPFGAKKFDGVGLIPDSDLSSFFLIQLVEAITGWVDLYTNVRSRRNARGATDFAGIENSASL